MSAALLIATAKPGFYERPIAGIDERILMREQAIPERSAIIIGNTSKMYKSFGLNPKILLGPQLLSLPGDPPNENVTKVCNCSYRDLYSIKDQVLSKLLFALNGFRIIILSDFALAPVTVAMLKETCEWICRRLDVTIIMYVNEQNKLRKPLMA